jgi:hypothetical protein
VRCPPTLWASRLTTADRGVHPTRPEGLDVVVTDERAVPRSSDQRRNELREDLESLVRGRNAIRLFRAELARAYRIRSNMLATESARLSPVTLLPRIPQNGVSEETHRTVQTLDAEAGAARQRGIELYQALDREFPDELEYAYRTAELLKGQGEWSAKQGDPRRAAKLCLEAAGLLASKLNDREGTAPEWSYYRHRNEVRQHHVEASLLAGDHLQLAGELDKADQTYLIAFRELELLPREWQIGLYRFPPLFAQMAASLRASLQQKGQSEAAAYWTYRSIEFCDDISRILRDASEPGSRGHQRSQLAGMSLDSVADIVASCYGRLASELSRQGELEIAEALLEKSLGLREQFCADPRLHAKYAPCLAANLRVLGDVLAAKADAGDPEAGGEAEQAYRSALKLQPDSPDIHRALGELLAGLGRFDTILAMARERVRRSPDDPECRLRLATAIIRSGARTEGLAELDKAMELAPPHSIVCGRIIIAFASSANSSGRA